MDLQNSSKVRGSESLLTSPIKPQPFIASFRKIDWENNAEQLILDRSQTSGPTAYMSKM